MKLRKQSHVVYQTQYHIVWITRYRRKILTTGVDTYLKIKLLEITKYYPDWDFIAIGTDKDHIHIQIIFPPKYSISKVVETIKSNTSRVLKLKFKSFLSKVYWDNKGIWGTGYFVSTIGLDEKLIKRYVEQQGEEETGQAKPVALL
jgi:putative transposase